MKTDTREKILGLLGERGELRVHDLALKLKISKVAVHKQLRQLVDSGRVVKKGKPPVVFYALVSGSGVQESSIDLDLSNREREVLDKYYAYVSPEGELVEGEQGFWRWLVETRQTSQGQTLVKRFVEQRLMANRLLRQGWIVATGKLKDTFDKSLVDELVYGDFYSLPQFGRTKLGQLVLHAKSAEQVGLMERVVGDQASVIGRIIEEYKIQQVAFVPHSLPRKRPFLKEVERMLQLSLPRVELIKAYTGEVLVAQKSLSKLSQRVINARETILIKDRSQVLAGGRVLVIDDAVGSGATMQEVAEKLKRAGAEMVVGYAVVGSMKGFEVIREV